MKRFFSFLRDNRGVSALEYAVLAGVVIAAVSVGVSGTDGQGGLKKSITGLFTSVSGALDTAAGKTAGTGSSGTGTGTGTTP